MVIPCTYHIQPTASITLLFMCNLYKASICCTFWKLKISESMSSSLQNKWINGNLYIHYSLVFFLFLVTKCIIWKSSFILYLNKTVRATSFLVCITEIPLLLTFSLHIRSCFNNIALKKKKKCIWFWKYSLLQLGQKYLVRWTKHISICSWRSKQKCVFILFTHQPAKYCTHNHW